MWRGPRKSNEGPDEVERTREEWIGLGKGGEGHGEGEGPGKGDEAHGRLGRAIERMVRSREELKRSRE